MKFNFRIEFEKSTLGEDMGNKVQASAKLFSLLFFVAAIFSSAVAQHQHSSQKVTAGKGILLLAHGGSQQWNEEVSKLASVVDKTAATEVAFGMATKRNIQAAVDRLIARGVTEIVAVPLFVSSHSSVITSTHYLLGLRKEAPRELAIYAKMDHGHGGHENHSVEMKETASDPMMPVKSSVPIRMTSALDRHAIVSDILFSRAQSISRQPKDEVVIVVAHGPVSDEENAKWLADMSALVEQMTKKGGFKRVEYMTVRDDAPEPLRSQATAELRKMVERATAENKQVLIVPLLMSFGGIEGGVKKRLEGLSYTMCKQALLPDNRLAEWVLISAGVRRADKP
jgi:sirohydrochlorin ferrochelatase